MESTRAPTVALSSESYRTTQQDRELESDVVANLVDVRVSTSDAPIGCEQAESIMELEEGTANYVANAIALDVGVL